MFALLVLKRMVELNMSMKSKIVCEHCGKEYPTEQALLEDCFVSADGWAWDYFHNCLKNKGNEIHGYHF